MSQYLPFDKPITDIQTPDLVVLESVSESWYVDYKSDLIGAGGMAKALSAFANTYGGWLFFGVKERSKEDPVAGQFGGLTTREVDVVQQRLRQSAAVHLNPTVEALNKERHTISRVTICVYIQYRGRARS